MKILEGDLEFITKILPDHYSLSIEGNNAIRCKSRKGIQNNDREDEEHWGYVFEGIKQYFGKRFSEVYHLTCTFHCDFCIYLK